MPEYRRVVRSTEAYEGADTATPGMLTLDPDTVVEVVSEADRTFTRALYLGKELLLRREDTVPVSEEERAARPAEPARRVQAVPPETGAATYCPQCASPVSAGAGYCTRCGSNLMTGGVAGRDLAGFWSRFGALFIDSVLTSIITGVLFAALIGGDSRGGFIFLGLIVSGAYFTIGYGMGVTLGALVFGLRIVTADGSEPGFGRGTIRWLVSIISYAALYLGYFWMLWNEEKQTWQDKAAGTFVVKDLEARRREIERQSSDG